MNIGYLGIGAWGYCLANLLADHGHKVIAWGRDREKIDSLARGNPHPHFLKSVPNPSIRFSTDMEELLRHAEILVEGVSVAGIRPVMEEVKRHLPNGKLHIPIVITSKGIEQKSFFLPHEIILAVFGKEAEHLIGIISGPGFAQEVMQRSPGAVVCSAYEPSLIEKIRYLFSTPFFRVYPNSDIHGVAFGGAVKNIVAMISGATDALQWGMNTKASIATRGLHEMKKLCILKKGNMETLNGLSGMGDLMMTCFSSMSRNYRFGQLIARGNTCEEAKEKIGMVVEGAYTVVSVRNLARSAHLEAPLTETAYSVLYEEVNLNEALQRIMQREAREERL